MPLSRLSHKPLRSHQTDQHYACDYGYPLHWILEQAPLALPPSKSLIKLGLRLKSLSDGICEKTSRADLNSIFEQFQAS